MVLYIHWLNYNNKYKNIIKIIIVIILIDVPATKKNTNIQPLGFIEYRYLYVLLTQVHINKITFNFIYE